MKKRSTSPKSRAFAPTTINLIDTSLPPPPPQLTDPELCITTSPGDHQSDEDDEVSSASPPRAQTWLEATTAGFRPKLQTAHPALTTHTSNTMSRTRPGPLRPLSPPGNLVHELHAAPPLPIRP